MIARDGVPFVLIGLVITLVCLWAGTRWDSVLLWILSTLFAVLTVAVTFFFRDPNRFCPDEAGLVVSPADGTVLSIDTLPSHPVTGPQTIKISIFLSVFNVHVNRVPVSGKVDYVKYVPGKFLVAYADKASDINEHTEIGMTDGTGQKIVFKQIAGILARRIVCRIKGGEELRIGDRFGLIRFGSRMDIFLPSGTTVIVTKSDVVKGGETRMAQLPGTSLTDQTSAKSTEAADRI
jgi:phosphatidylserine decarboxylase